MARKFGILICVVLIMAFAMPAMAGQFIVLDGQIAAARANEIAAGKRAANFRAAAMQARLEADAYFAAERAAAAGAALARVATEEAMARQDRRLNLLALVLPVGFTMAWYNAGEMDFVAAQIMALRRGEPGPGGCASGWGIWYVIRKVPAGAPECMATYGYGRLTGHRWNWLDPYSVFTEYGRPALGDFFVTGSKVVFGLIGAGAIHGGTRHIFHFRPVRHVHRFHATLLPALGGHTGPIEQAFLWMAAGGGSLNLLTGAANQFFQPSYWQYYNRVDWLNSRRTLPATGL